VHGALWVESPALRPPAASLDTVDVAVVVAVAVALAVAVAAVVFEVQ
jgi:hypothetical protein